MSKPKAKGGLSPEEQIELSKLKGYLQEVDCNTELILKELQHDPSWQLNTSDREQYQEVFRELENAGFKTAKCVVEEKPIKLVRQMRAARLSIEARFQELQARAAATPLGTLCKGERRLLQTADGKLREFVTLPVAAQFGGVGIRAIQKAVHSDKLDSQGAGTNRRIRVASLLKYFPSEK